MKLVKGKAKWDKEEPVWRSCWECNKAHEHLKKATYFINCFSCGKNWLRGQEVTCEADAIRILKGLKKQ